MGNATDGVFLPWYRWERFPKEDLMSDPQGFAEIDEPKIERLPSGAPPRRRAGAGRGGTAG
jgi:hypothetical protein